MRGPAGGDCAVKSVPGAMTRCSNGDDDLGRTDGWGLATRIGALQTCN